MKIIYFKPDERGLLVSVYERLQDLSLDEEYRVIVPSEEDYLMNYFFIDENGDEFLNIAKIAFNEYEGGYYIGSEEYPYRILVKIGDDVETLNIHPQCVCVHATAGANHMNLKTINISSNQIKLGQDAFSCCKNLRTVIFNVKQRVVVLSDAFCECNRLTNITYGDAEYEFYNGSFAGERKYFILPNHLVKMGEFLSKETTVIYVPKNVTSISPLFEKREEHIKDCEIYYEGDAKELLLKKRVYERYETEEDYGWNFHRSSGSFTYHEVNIPAIYGGGENCHSFVSLDDFLKMVKERNL